MCVCLSVCACVPALACPSAPNQGWSPQLCSSVCPSVYAPCASVSNAGCAAWLAFQLAPPPSCSSCLSQSHTRRCNVTLAMSNIHNAAVVTDPGTVTEAAETEPRHRLVCCCCCCCCWNCSWLCCNCCLFGMCCSVLWNVLVVARIEAIVLTRAAACLYRIRITFAAAHVPGGLRNWLTA